MKDSEIKKLLLQYNEILKKLKDNHVIRTSKLVGEYGEYVAKNKLDLTLADSGNKGYDATDDKGNKYEIKSRKEMPYNKPNRWNMGANRLKLADFLICVEFDNDWNLSRFYKIPKSKVIMKGKNVYFNKELEKYNIL